jgi:N-acylneuraminate cytidylyltransferase
LPEPVSEGLVNIVALIPARGGSKRIPRKNVKLLGGKPLIQWTIDAAKASGVFFTVIVSTDDEDTKRVALDAGAGFTMRPDGISGDASPDIYWVRDAMERQQRSFIRADAFMILRPTSPFRTAVTIRRATEQFAYGKCSSIRAVEPVRQHPGKMWQERYGSMTPLIADEWPAASHEAGLTTRIPWHSQPTQSLPKVYVQNSSLEIAWTWCVTVFDSISGPKVAPFFTEEWEGFSIDYPEDWDRAERHVADLQAAASTQ